MPVFVVQLTNRLLLAGAGLVAVIAAAPASAEVYRYVDEDGVTVYSQSPPAVPQASPATTVPVAPSPPAANFDAARQRLQQQLEAEVDALEAGTKAATAQEQADTEAASRAQACAAARQNLATLEDLGVRLLRRPDGTMEPVGDAEREQLISETRQQIEDLCP